MNKKTILLVDDVLFFLEQEKTFFNRSDFELLIARSGVEALEIIRRERPDLVFMDLYMPEMNGDRCCHIIKTDDDLKVTPVIMVTSGSDDGAFELCWEAGCDDIITKPINRLYLLAITKKYLPFMERKVPRYTARILIRYGIDDNTVLTDYSVNVSTGGVFIETLNFLPHGTLIGVEFILPDRQKSIRCRGKVAWINHPEMIKNPNLPVGMGLQFLNISFDDMQTIRQYIKDESLVAVW